VIEAPETPHPPHSHNDSHKDDDKRGGPRWFDIMITLTLVIISMGSLYVSIHTGETMEKLVKQNERMVRASSTPLLQFGHGNVTTEGSGDKSHPALTFSVQNVGTGPARVAWFEVCHEGKPLRVFDDLTKALKPDGTLNMTNITAPIANTLMTAGEERRIVLWKRPADADAIGVETWKRVDDARWRLEVETWVDSTAERNDVVFVVIQGFRDGALVG
jgi:hypothetical protein